MKRTLITGLILGCMLAAGNLLALDSQDDRQAPGSRKTPVEKHDPPAKPRSQQRPKPATTFRPSEKISADSAVSFPVDI